MRAVQGSGVVGKEEGEELVLAVEGGRDLGAGNSLDSLTLFWTTKGDEEEAKCWFYAAAED